MYDTTYDVSAQRLCKKVQEPVSASCEECLKFYAVFQNFKMFMYLFHDFLCTVEIWEGHTGLDRLKKGTEET